MGAQTHPPDPVNYTLGLRRDNMKCIFLALVLVLFSARAIASPVGLLNVQRCVEIATNAISQQLPHISLSDLRFDNAKLYADSDKKSITVWFFRPIPDPKWEARGMEHGILVSVSMDLNGKGVVAAESKATIARKPKHENRKPNQAVHRIQKGSK